MLFEERFPFFFLFFMVCHFNVHSELFYTHVKHFESLKTNDVSGKGTILNTLYFS